MNEIYVVGHRNPDTDSIVAAMSYAALRNALGDRDYVAAYLGHVSDETQRLLNRFGFQPPQLIQNVRTQVSDLDYDTPPALNATVTMDRAWHIMREQRISAIPVVNEDGTLYGTLSAGDIATYSMNTISEPRVEALPLFNLLSVIEGRVLNDTGDLVDSVTGDVVIALPQSCENLLWNGKDHIVLCGDQPDMIRRALETNVCCLSSARRRWIRSCWPTPGTPASSPVPTMPAGWPVSSIRPSPSPALATLTTSSASICRTILTTCGRWC